MPASRSLRTVILSGASDVALVVVFALVGRSSHGESVAGGGLWSTVWPFVAALAVGWLVTAAWRNPTALARTGLGVWAFCVGGGLLLRALTGQGTALSFVVVTAVVLGVLLLGWRAAVGLWFRAASRRSARFSSSASSLGS